MAFVKLYKNNAYFKRYQTKYRRRREGKTDYYARKRLTMQDKDKYNTQKYRMVTRITSGKVICQVTYATLTGDKVLCEANSTELRRYGLETGFTNYPAAYATGLLLARRLLKQTKLDSLYKGVSTVTGENYNVADEANEDRAPFKCVLDVGLTHTTTGNRVFGALKGAVDGGLHIPHNSNRFPGFYKDQDETSYDASVHRDRILGVHVDNYMKSLKESPEDFKAQFSNWSKCLTNSKSASVQALFTKIHSEIRKNPDRVTRKPKASYKRDQAKFTLKKINAAQKQANAAKRIEIALKNRK